MVQHKVLSRACSAASATQHNIQAWYTVRNIRLLDALHQAAGTRTQNNTLSLQSAAEQARPTAFSINISYSDQQAVDWWRDARASGNIEWPSSYPSCHAEDVKRQTARAFKTPCQPCSADTVQLTQPTSCLQTLQ
jgi:hypothetical protein